MKGFVSKESMRTSRRLCRRSFPRRNRRIFKVSRKTGEELPKESCQDKLKIKLERLLSNNTGCTTAISEESRRMQEMMKMYAISGMPMGELPLEESLVLNEKHP